MVALAWVTLLAAVLPPGAGAQNSDAPRRFNVDADSLSIRRSGQQNVLVLHRNVKIDDGDVVIRSRRGSHFVDDRHTILVGDVVITQETMTLWGDEGEYLQAQALAIIRGNVRIEDEGWIVTADSVEYNRDTGYAWLRGNVVAEDGETTLRADRIFYDRNAEMAEAFDDVFVESEKEGFSATGDHGFYYRGSREAVLDQNPRLTVDPDSRDPVTVDSDTMRVYPDSGQAMAYYRVKILKADMVTQCDSAVVFDQRKEALLFGNPLAQQNNVSMKGQYMRLYYDE
jgi:lipopolysaccharide export system protein LptA